MHVFEQAENWIVTHLRYIIALSVCMVSTKEFSEWIDLPLCWTDKYYWDDGLFALKRPNGSYVYLDEEGYAFAIHSYTFDTICLPSTIQDIKTLLHRNWDYTESHQHLLIKKDILCDKIKDDKISVKRGYGLIDNNGLLIQQYNSKEGSYAA